MSKLENPINIRISLETHAELNKLGSRDETFDDIVKRLVNFYKEKTKDEK